MEVFTKFTMRGAMGSPYYTFLIFVKGIVFPGPGNIDVHCNSIGFGKGKGKRKILQSTPGPGIHYNSIGFVKGAGRPSPLSLTGGRSKGFASKDTEGC